MTPPTSQYFQKTPILSKLQYGGRSGWILWVRIGEVRWSAPASEEELPLTCKTFCGVMDGKNVLEN